MTALLRAADVEIGGSDPWDIDVRDDRFYDRVLADGSLGAGEAYMDGWWDVERLDEFFARVHHAAVDRMLITPAVVAAAALSRLRNAQRPRLSRRVARQHLRPAQHAVRVDAWADHAVHLRLLRSHRHGPHA